MSRVDVKLPLQIAALDSSIGQKWTVGEGFVPDQISAPPRPNREASGVLTERRLSELRQRGVDFLKQLVRALIFGRGPCFFKVAFGLRALRLHRGQCAEVEIDDRACDAAVA